MNVDLDIDVVRDGVGAVVVARGELDLATAPRLRSQLAGLVGEGVVNVAVDLAELEFIDSSGLNVLVTALKEMRAHGGDLVLRSPQPATLRVLEITGLAALFALGRPDSPSATL